MSRIFSYLFVLSILSIFAIRFGDCDTTQSDVDCNEKIEPGSDKVDLSTFEKMVGKILKYDLQFEDAKPSGKIVKKLEEFGLIAPGTRWCGDGDKARDEGDLGFFKNTDACCREHDKCENNIVAGKTKANLKNNGFFTKSACTCDEKFYECLKNADNLLAWNIGKSYFNILQPRCFSCVCLTENCKESENDTECKNRCTRYKWFKNRKY